MFDCGWLWLYAGAALMLLELLTPGFIAFFFGLAAAATGLCRLAFGEAFSPTWQMAAMSFFSVLFLAVLRRWFKQIFVGEKEASRANGACHVGRRGTVVEAIVPPRSGRVEIGDAAWTAVADAAIDRGANVLVTGQDNLTLKVEAIK